MRALDVLERLVRPYSPSGAEAPAVSAFLRTARELGFSVRRDAAGNGIARSGRGHPRVLFLGHIDTIEGALPVRRRRGRLSGRGTVDAKGALAAALLSGPALSGRGEYTVAAAVGEETDSRGARHLLAGAAPDAVIAGEPSSWDGVTVGYKGELQLEGGFREPRTHLGSPFPTVVDRALDWVRSVRTYAAERSGSSPFRSLAAKTVRFESDAFGDPGTARVVVDFRLPPGLTTAELLRSLPPGPRSRRVRIRVEPLEVDPSNPVVRSLVDGIRASGGRPTLWRKTGTSDLNLAVPAWRVPGAAYGPGNARLDHTDRESLSLAELDRAVAVLTTALDRLRSGGLTLRGSADGA